VKEQVAADF